MRLLNSATRELSEFQSDIPPYAILSHVWEQEEVTFHDITDLDKAQKMLGFTKIIGACNAAMKHGLKYVWIDTCCINKDSSAEVSEAINSMYMWYKNSRVCYAYLSDVPSEDDHENICSFFATSLWFTRGWTLQELIAPRRVIFYGTDWTDIGTKATLRHTISTITGIDVEIIMDGDLDHLNSIPVAVRMSWAADRNTTREEDMAYSLMGLFGVTMPLLYGEKGKAFIRLQHEIIKQSDDHSIFAWSSQEEGERGILARSPREFRNSENIERILEVSEDSKPFFITNKGLRIDLPTLVKTQTFFERVVLVLLQCRFKGEPDPIAIELSCFSPQGKLIRPEKAILTYTRTRPTQLSGLKQGVGVFREWMRQSLQLVKSESVYIIDDYFKANDGASKTSYEILLKLKVPAEYGKIHRTEFQQDDGWRETSENEWKYTGDQEGILVFERLGGRDQFSMIVGKREEGFMYCDLWTGLEKQGEQIERHFLDRASVNLTDGWSVTISSGTSDYISNCSDEFRLHAEVEIKKSPASRISPPTINRPDGKLGCLIVPPPLKHGFSVPRESLRDSSEVNWVQHSSCFVLYLERQSSQATGILTFKNAESGDEFSLLVERKEGGIDSKIEGKMSDTGHRQILMHSETHSKAAYNVALPQGKTVFVTVRRCRDASVADFIINLSM